VALETEKAQLRDLSGEAEKWSNAAAAAAAGCLQVSIDGFREERAE